MTTISDCMKTSMLRKLNLEGDGALPSSIQLKAIEHKINQLEKAANDESFQGFNSLTKDIGLSCCDYSQVIRIINACLLMNAMALARELSEKAKIRFPGDLKIDKLSKVLSPPRIIAGEPASSTSSIFSFDVIKENINDLKDKWIAVRDGSLIDSGSSLPELMKSVPRDKIDNKTTIVKVVR